MIQIIVLLIALIISVLIFLFFTFSLIDEFVVRNAPFVPASCKIIDDILNFAELKKEQKFIDLGCGNAQLLVLADKKYQAKTIGYEKGIIPFILSKINCWFHKSKTKIYFKNLFKADLADADFVFCYLLPKTLEKLEQKFAKELKGGAKVITLVYQLPNKKPSKITKFSKINKLNQVFLYEY